MKKLITTLMVCGLSAQSFAANSFSTHYFAKANASVTYLINEDFEGTGLPTGWFEAGSPNYDYSSAGTQWLKITTATSQYGGKVLSADQGTIWGKYEVRFESGMATAFYINLVDGSFTDVFRIAVLSTGEAYVQLLGSTDQTSATMAADTKYFVWFRYTVGGGANALGDVWWNTTDTKPANGSANHASITTGSAMTDINNFRIGVSAALNLNIDNLKLSATEFQ